MTKLKNRLAEIQKRRAAGDKGFSLVELAVVIVVIGILVAIAVPVFNGIQDGAKQSVADAAAANGSSMVASELALGNTVADSALEGLLPADAAETDTIALTPTTGADLTNYCVTAEIGGKTGEKGPGCPATP